jgi:spore germination protein GerM
VGGYLYRDRRWARRVEPTGMRTLIILLICAIWSTSAILPVGCAAAEGNAVGAGTTSFWVYFHNEALAADPANCTAVFPVRRAVPRTPAVGSAALRSLFSGPSPEERAQGYRSFFSPATANLLRGLQVKDGTAYVDLEEPRDLLADATSSCGAAEFQSEVAATLEQFPFVERVVYLIDGDPRAFYVWMGED